MPEHRGDLFNARGPVRLIVGVPPYVRFANLRMSKILSLLRVQFDDTNPNIGSTDVHSEDRLVP